MVGIFEGVDQVPVRAGVGQSVCEREDVRFKEVDVEVERVEEVLGQLGEMLAPLDGVDVV